MHGLGQETWVLYLHLFRVIFFCGLSSILLIHIPVPIDACVYVCVCVCVYTYTTFNLFLFIFRVMDFSVYMLHFFFCLFASSLPSLFSSIILLIGLPFSPVGLWPLFYYISFNSCSVFEGMIMKGRSMWCGVGSLSCGSSLYSETI